MCIINTVTNLVSLELPLLWGKMKAVLLTNMPQCHSALWEATVLAKPNGCICNCCYSICNQMSCFSLNPASLVNEIPNPSGTNLDKQSLKTPTKSCKVQMGVHGTECSQAKNTILEVEHCVPCTPTYFHCKAV